MVTWRDPSLSSVTRSPFSLARSTRFFPAPVAETSPSLCTAWSAGAWTGSPPLPEMAPDVEIAMTTLS